MMETSVTTRPTTARQQTSENYQKDMWPTL